MIYIVYNRNGPEIIKKRINNIQNIYNQIDTYYINNQLHNKMFYFLRKN